MTTSQEHLARALCWNCSGCECESPKQCTGDHNAEAFAAAEKFERHLRAEGLAIMPVEPTPGMQQAGEWTVLSGKWDASLVYKAMLKAAHES